MTSGGGSSADGHEASALVEFIRTRLQPGVVTEEDIRELSSHVVSYVQTLAVESDESALDLFWDGAWEAIPTEDDSEGQAESVDDPDEGSSVVVFLRADYAPRRDFVGDLQDPGSAHQRLS